MADPSISMAIPGEARTVRHLADHAGGEIPDYHEWVYLGRTEYRDALGRMERPWVVENVMGARGRNG